jgi:hypothetical protein
MCGVLHYGQYYTSYLQNTINAILHTFEKKLKRLIYKPNIPDLPLLKTHQHENKINLSNAIFFGSLFP